RRYPIGQTGTLDGRSERFGTPRPGHGHVWITYRTESTCSALWRDEYPEPDENGARVGHAFFDGDYAAVVAEVIRASIDGFHLPRARRYRRGQYSAEGCYFDTFDYDALRRVLLDPLGPHGDRRIRRAVFDHRTDTALSQPAVTTPEHAVLLFDGVFLLRPELVDQWDMRIFVSVAFEEALERARSRDQALFGSVAEVERRYRERYIP